MALRDCMHSNIRRFEQSALCDLHANALRVKHPELSPPRMRIIADWILDVHDEYHLSDQSYYLAINILYRFLTDPNIESFRTLDVQVLASVVSTLASKVEDVTSIDLEQYVMISTFGVDRALRLELQVLRSLNWSVSAPTPLTFLETYLSVAKTSSLSNQKKQGKRTHDSRRQGASDGIIHNLVCFHLEAAQQEMDTSIKYTPSLQCVSAVFLVYKANASCDVCDALLAYAGYGQRSEVEECASKLIEAVDVAIRVVPSGSLTKSTVYKRYSRAQRMNVASLCPLRLDEDDVSVDDEHDKAKRARRG